MEKNGTPAVGIFTEAFERDARASCRAIGVPFLPLALVPTILSNEPPDTIRGYGEAIYPKVVEAFTKVPTGPGATSTQEAEEQEALTFHGDDLLDAAEAMNRTLVEYNWSDGFPLVPPTGSWVDRMLAGTQEPRDHIVAVLEPGFWLATVVQIAINAVMARCQPGHLPVLIAAVEAMADPYYRLRAVSCSTGPHAPLLVINGPVAKELKVNSGLCCFGPGGPSYANTVIGGRSGLS